MKLLAFVISWIASSFLTDDWIRLRGQLISIYRSKQFNASRRQIPLQMEQLLISGEDHRFFTHGGVDFIAIARALWRYVSSARREGASTIEMQVVRVITGRYERTLARKATELALATLVTRVVPKGDLPSLYLHIGYFGWRMNGYAAARARLRGIANLSTPLEAARLVARLKYPQPRVLSMSRRVQIERRACHLFRLRERHISGRIYRDSVVRPEYAD